MLVLVATSRRHLRMASDSICSTFPWGALTAQKPHLQYLLVPAGVLKHQVPNQHPGTCCEYLHFPHSNGTYSTYLPYLTLPQINDINLTYSSLNFPMPDLNIKGALPKTSVIFWLIACHNYIQRFQHINQPQILRTPSSTSPSSCLDRFSVPQLALELHLGNTVCWRPHSQALHSTTPCPASLSELRGRAMVTLAQTSAHRIVRHRWRLG